MNTMDLIIEIGTNLVQSFMFIGFLYFMLERKFTKGKNISCFLICVAVIFSVCNWFLFNDPLFSDIDSILYIAIMYVYTLTALKGNPLFKLAICVLAFSINAALSYLFGFLVSALTGVSFLDLATKPVIGRYLCMAVITVTNILVFLMIVKLKRSRLTIIRKSDLASFVVVPILALVIIHSTVLALVESDFMSNLLPYLLAIDISMIAVTVIIWLMMSRISKDNEQRTKLLLAEQHAEMYRENTIQVSEQIEKVSHIRHDMNDNIRCIENLIDSKNYIEAKEYCKRVSKHFNSAYTPVATANPLLNAILNVQLERAAEAGLEIIIKISDDMSDYGEFADIVPAIGNLCRNAIDYLKNHETSDRRISFTAKRDEDYYFISCTNAINGSVLSENPQLETSKSDKADHGHGISIIRAAAQKHSGDLIYKEENGYITFTMYFE